MPGKKPEAEPSFKVGDRVRNKLNHRVGTIDAVDGSAENYQYGLHYDEELQDRYLTRAGHDGAQLPSELIERE
jgi:hypothetical protein